MKKLRQVKKKIMGINHRWKRNYAVVPPRYTKPIETNPALSDIMGEVIKSTLGR